MKRNPAKNGIVLGLIVLVLLFWTGCDPGTIITMENRTNVPVDASYQTVGLNDSGPVTPSFHDLNPEFMPPGSTQRFASGIYPDRRYVAKDGSYVIVNDEHDLVQVSDKYDPDWKAPWNKSGQGGDGGGD
jgi:hypothetical protein